MALLRDVAERVRAAGWAIEHVDATVMAEAPKLSPHKQAMRVALGAVLGSVSVKATTGERMGFVGRGEGIAALAVATLSG
jgi:2-C-methyl-D-erythritol 2,4-cyclodiphosphate synthase